MFPNIKQRLIALRAGKPGGRFEEYFASRHGRGAGAAQRALLLILGVVVVLVGIVLMPLPGPGMLIVAGGLAIMAGESRTVARWLDRGELRLRQWLQRWRRRRG